MKVAIITENFLPKVDGVTRTLARLLEHLEANGHEALLLGPESGMATYAGAELVGTWGIPFLPYPGLKLNMWRPLFGKKLQEFQPDVIHVVDPVWLGAMAERYLAMFFPHIPIVSSYHTNLAAYCGHFGWGIFSPFMWAWNRSCHNATALTFCPSNSTAKMLKQQGFHSARIWPRGVDGTLFSHEKRSNDVRLHWLQSAQNLSPADADLYSKCSSAAAINKTILLYVGRVSYEKNLNLLIDAYLAMDHTSTHLVIVGHGPAMSDIQAKMAAAQAPITFTGYLQGENLAAAYASSDIFAFPSRTETFGQVVLESLSSGLPVVGVVAEGVQDLVTDGRTGLLIDGEESWDHQVVAYRQALQRLVDDVDERQKFSRQARQDAGAYTWFEAMECMVRGYREVVRKARREAKASDTIKIRSTAPAEVLEGEWSGDSGVGEDMEEDEVHSRPSSPAGLKHLRKRVSVDRATVQTSDASDVSAILA